MAVWISVKKSSPVHFRFDSTVSPRSSTYFHFCSRNSRFLGDEKCFFFFFFFFRQFLDSNIDEAAKDPACGCPELSTDQLNMFFKTYSPKFLFNLVKGFEAQKLGPLASCGGLKSIDTNLIPKVDLPSSCTAERWNAGQGCQAAIKRTEGDLKLVLRMEKCAGREFPFFEVKCEGKDCDTILTPCTADNECSDGTNFSCLEFTNTADQCAEETCTMGGFRKLTSATASKCVAGAYESTPLSGGCSLNGAQYGPGFSYYYDADDQGRTKTPKSEADIGKCVQVTCSAGGKWSDASPASPESCFRALTTRKPATGAQCTNAGEVIQNPLYPHTSENTCNWREIDDAKEYEIANAVKPFAVGSSRYVSNSDDLLGQFFGYDAVDYTANPFGCRKSSDAVRSLVQLARKITDRHAGRAERTLSNSNVIGVCVPGQGYTLEAVSGSSSSGFQRYQLRGPMTDPTVVLKDNFGLTCSLNCTEEERTTAPASTPSSSLFVSTGETCTQQESTDFLECSNASCLTASGSSSDFCQCYQSVVQCFVQKSTRWCDSYVTSISSFESGRDTFCRSSAGGSGSSGLDGNCTASCGKDAFVYSGAAYGDAQKFDGASARKVRSVKAVTEGATVLAHVDCSMSIALLPNHPVLGVELSVSYALEFLFGFRNEHRDAYKCRGPVHGGAALTDDQYNVRAFTFNNPLYFMTLPVSTQLTNLGVKFKDLRTRLLSSGIGRLAIPKSCTFDNWFSQGQCRLTFTGLGNAELIGEKTDLNAYLSVCPGSFLPEAYVECVGKGCKVFNGPIGCATDSDCGLAGFRCNKFDDVVTSSGSSSSGGGRVVGYSSRPSSESSQRSLFDAVIQNEAPNAGAFLFTSQIDISGATLEVRFDLPKGVTDGAELLVIKGPYTGKFSSVEYTALSRDGSCDSESITGMVSYKADGIYVSTTCTCTVSGKRSVTMPKDLQLGTSIKNAYVKRQQATQDDGPRVDTIATGFLGMFRADKQECANSYQTSLLPKLMATISGETFKPGNNGICFVDTNKRDAQGRLAAEVWANDQVEIDGSTVTLKYLKGWLEDSSVQPIDDGKSLQDKFGKSADWFEKTGRFCVSCEEGSNTDVGKTAAAASINMALSAAIVAIMVVLFQ
jgi:hypothetical protein